MLIENTTFRLVAGADEGLFLAADAEAQAALSPAPGFVRRTTARGSDGEWLVAALWWDAEHADRAPATPGLTAHIDETTLTVRRYTTLD